MRLNLFVVSCLMAVASAAQKARVITVTYSNTRQPVVEPSQIDGMKITVRNGSVKIKDWRTNPSDLVFTLRGESDDGQFVLNTEAETNILLDGLALTSKEGAPIHLKNKKKAVVSAKPGTENTLTIQNCQDTARHKASVLWAKTDLLLCGKGTLHILAAGNGCKGIVTKGDLTIKDLKLSVQTTGDNLGVDTTRQMGFGGPPPDFDPDSIPEEVKARFEDMPDDMKAHFENMRKHFEKMAADGQLPGQGGANGMAPLSHFQGPAGGMPPGKQKYISTCKGIKAKGTVTILSGQISVSTSSPGAEGIEGKQGIVISGGNIDVCATDDAINSGGQILFSGGRTQAISTTNDAVDSNYGGGMFRPTAPLLEAELTQKTATAKTTAENKATKKGKATEKNKKPATAKEPTTAKGEAREPAIIISGGEVLAWSQNGPPEEGLDCDFSPIQISGGTVFTIGACMGETPSVPTQETAKQPTALLSGLNIKQNTPILLSDSKGKTLCQFVVPFSFEHSYSLLSHPSFRLGAAYTVRCGSESRSFTLSGHFTHH